MSYIEKQRQKAIKIRDGLFKDAGGGIFKSIEREFVLKEPSLNLWAGIREDVINYFNEHKITFWNSKEEPTGHLLSSQVACLNHLNFVRQRQDIASAILQNIEPKIRRALPLNKGFVEFEVIGKKNYLKEKSHTRGANSTSVDAVMLGEVEQDKNILFFIEWKYTASYTNASRASGSDGKTRLEIYSPLLTRPDCPIRTEKIESLFVEPYYQLMRQTLLADEMVKAREYGAIYYVHLHVIPTENVELKGTTLIAC